MVTKPSTALVSLRDGIRRIVEAIRARNHRFNGSVLHGDGTEAGDLDILVEPTFESSLFDIGVMAHELKALPGVPEHAATPNALPAKARDQSVSEAQRI